MARKPRVLTETKTYHVMIRGNCRQDIFIDNDDRLRFVDILYEKSRNGEFLIYAFCLMDNHVHLLLNDHNHELSRVMKCIQISYVYYFNKKYDRKGHLFQDRFKSEPISDDSYLLTAVRYIHNNPVKAGIVKCAEQYKWSSFNAYFDTTHLYNGLVNIVTILDLFSKNMKEAVEKFKEFNVQSLENMPEDVFIECNDEFSDKSNVKKTILNTRDAEKYVERFLSEKGIKIDVLKLTPYKNLRNELIIELKKRSNLSIIKLSILLNLNRNIVQRTK